jgi:DNA (cytosine-5)-methyltransferase 1
MTFDINRPPQVRLYPGEIAVDHFAGAGGASVGIHQALGRPPDIAINHDARALAMHARNHPGTKHYREDIWEVDPVEACAGRPVGLLWMSPDCKHFSRAKGKTPVQNGVRGLAWVLPKWCKAVSVRSFVLENVPEFEDWGPLIEVEKDGKTILRPDPTRKGETFREWMRQMTELGYTIEYRMLNCADYGAPTTRKRLFLIGHKLKSRVTFPEATHGKGRPQPWVPASDIIDWSLSCQSVFNRKKPLAEATMNRIAMGVERYVVKGQPFIVRHGHYSKVTGAGLRPGCGAGLFRGQSLNTPIATVCATNDKNLVVPWITKHYGGMVVNPMTMTLGTVTAVDSNGMSAALLRPACDGEDRSVQTASFLMKYYKSGICKPVTNPLDTVTTKGRFALVEVQGVPHRIIDIGTRMLSPGELYRSHGFDDDFNFIEPGPGLKPFTQREQTRMVGNSVPPPVARALVEEALAEG